MIANPLPSLRIGIRIVHSDDTQTTKGIHMMDLNVSVHFRNVNDAEVEYENGDGYEGLRIKSNVDGASVEVFIHLRDDTRQLLANALMAPTPGN